MRFELQTRALLILASAVAVFFVFLQQVLFIFLSCFSRLNLLDVCLSLFLVNAFSLKYVAYGSCHSLSVYRTFVSVEFIACRAHIELRMI